MAITAQNALFIILGFIAVLGILFLVEFLFPLRNRKFSFLRRLTTNATLSILAFIIVYLIVTPAQNFTMSFSDNSSFGIVNILNLPSVLKGIIAFLLMDLAFYYWHYLNHRIPLLWRFHNVHHIDPDLDFTSAFRFHFGEIAFSTLFRVLQIGLIGVSPAVFVIYEFCFTANTIFQHSNVKLPIRFERILNRMIVTPRMHGIHHSQIKNETNSNYSTLFSCWDILHKTMCLNIPQNKIKIGVPGYSNPGDNNFINVILIPFKKQRDYWVDSSEKEMIESHNTSGENKLKLAE